MRRRKWKSLLILLFFLAGGISMIVMSLHYFQHDVTGVMKGKAVQDELWYRMSLRTHILLGMIAIIIGPFQFLERIRTKFPVLHRRLGYCYSICVFFSATTGLMVAQYPMGGIVSRLGFSTLAVFWLITLFLAIRAIRNKDIKTHRKWMFINYGLTFAAIPQRTLLLVPLIVNIEFMDIYRLSAWLPWILNTLVALYLVKRSDGIKINT